MCSLVHPGLHSTDVERRVFHSLLGIKKLKNRRTLIVKATKSPRQSGEYANETVLHECSIMPQGIVHHILKRYTSGLLTGDCGNTSLNSRSWKVFLVCSRRFCISSLEFGSVMFLAWRQRRRPPRRYFRVPAAAAGPNAQQNLFLKFSSIS